ncbi:YceK/YidQ family lipoprotein [Aquabacterium sp. CECT 9606]|uniref:YceK/YidQ family lipoprotein n=1 Tax=Aquabacterium sp. CECT 9606 TaxID=2845822 RepID=UPI001E543C0E|nr:YceK/YidQ family lipoprotein [Aquabacterium sp. CECT 9606]CAH0352833.1 hypothetical protein AQB9606_02837 [Aquabacterium sp. CECT 9606]
MNYVKIATALSALTLCSCASIVATTQGPSKNGSLVFAGTRLNASLIGKKSCEKPSPDNHGCAYDNTLAPFSLLDFIPSLAMDTLLLPFTALHAVLHPVHSSTSQEPSRESASDK